MSRADAIEKPDFEHRARTGMMRPHFIDCAKYVLTRAFKHVKRFEDPIVFLTISGSKTCRELGDPEWRHRSHDWETLERTLTLAWSLLHVEPVPTPSGVKIHDYDKLQLYNASPSGHCNSVQRQRS